MTNEKLIAALREDAEWAHANEWETPITLGDHLDAAVNALESLQAQLAESQRREQAAKEDINSMLNNVDSVICCHYCAKSKHGEYCGFDSEGENGELLHCPGEWRGPQEAGKGETE